MCDIIKKKTRTDFSIVVGVNKFHTHIKIKKYMDIYIP